jgi:hypothetical protein
VSHVKPHRWADALAGRIEPDEHAAMTTHAAGCARCTAARDRIAAGTGAMQSIKKDAPPDLGWDSIRARVHWDVSSARRSKPKIAEPGARRWLWLGAGGLAATTAAVASVIAFGGWHPFGGGGDAGGSPAPVASAAPASAVQPAASAAPAALVGVISRFSGEVMIDGIRRPDTFDHAVGPGALLATGDGRVDVQFGDASGLSLGPRSRLELRRFDAQSVELAVDGTVDVEVAPRSAGQRFVVVAGTQTIEVRGTQFRVRRDATGTHVACRHGLVAVRDASGEVSVGAAKEVDVRAGAAVHDARVAAMTQAELAELATATPVTTPAWSPAGGAATVELALEADAPRAVRVDGVELGDAPMRVRVTPGRHLVEARVVEAGGAGRFKRVEWVTVTADHPASVRVELAPPVPPPASAAADRRAQLLAGIDRARLERCVAPIARTGITDLYVQIEIGVDAAGSVSFLNLLDAGDLDAATASCVHDALAEVRFPAGGAASWHERISL